jgi:hypothetical protein
MDRRHTIVAALLLAGVCSLGRAFAGDTLEQPPQYGVYYDRYEPYFYTGFAPRTQDPQRIHLHVGRGDQLRATVVLSDATIQEYARDLQARLRSYRALIASGQLELTQNRGFEDFERTLADVALDRVVADEAKLTPSALRERNLHLLERLNPGRIFRIHLSTDELVRRWVAQVRPEDHRGMSPARRLELLNLLLPTRLFIDEMPAGAGDRLETLVARSAADVATLRREFLALLTSVTRGFYPVHDGALEFIEFTAIYPVGSLNDMVPYRGRKIPAYPTTGRRALTTHQRTQTVDHVPTDDSYSYAPWLPYIHIGPRMHDAIHTLWWKMEPASTSFLPPAWRHVDRGSRDGAAFRYLWLLSRGPMSHGCTHVNAGHIAELRQLLPSETARLYEVDLYLNAAPRYDVFDIDGDFTPEVMGVRYFIAYGLKGNQPDRLRVANERHAYYDWLYAGELGYDADDRGRFATATDGRFVARAAVDGSDYANIALYEAAYAPETIQFYRLVDIPFAQELRKVSLTYPFPGLLAAAGPR